MTSFNSCFTFVIFYTLVCRKIALVANVICLWKPTLNIFSCILYLVLSLGCTAVLVANSVVLSDVILTMGPIGVPYKHLLYALLNCHGAVLLYLWPIL